MLTKEKADRIRSLSDAEGHIEPSEVVADARDPSSPLHDEFNWNKEEAAEAHWLDTARGLIRFVRLEVQIEQTSVVAPFYVVDPIRPPRSKRYVELTTAARSADIANRVLIDECDRIVAAIRRAQSVAVVLGLSGQLDAMLADVSRLRSKAERAVVEKRRRRGVTRGGLRRRDTARPGQPRKAGKA
jgi:hypothetical protein